MLSATSSASLGLRRTIPECLDIFGHRDLVRISLFWALFSLIHLLCLNYSFLFTQSEEN